MEVKDHMLFMSEAIDMAIKSKKEGGIPIGSVLVKNGTTVIGKGHNQRVQKGSQVLHAEIDCLNNAGCQDSYDRMVLYSTLMPCYMCAGAIIQFKIPKLVVGDSKSFKGAMRLLRRNGVEIIDLKISTCQELLKEFIQENIGIWCQDIGKKNC